MHLTINFLDNFLDQPDLEQECPSDYVLVDHRNFQGGKVVLDNHQFAYCKFRGVAVLYSGGPFALKECDFDITCSLVLNGPAARGHVLWKKFDEMPGRYLPG